MATKEETHHDPHAEALAAVCGAGPEAADATTGVGLTSGGTLRGVLGGLSAGGGFSPLQLLTLIPWIVDMIAEYGPVVADIMKKVREKFGK